MAAFVCGATSAGDIRVERVRFPKGATGTTVTDAITGYETVDYLLGASAGQAMRVRLATDNDASYFNVLAPGEEEVAFFIGSTSGHHYDGVLPATGDYKVRVYLMRSAARRNEQAHYRLEMAVTGRAESAQSASATGHVDAVGKVPCAEHAGQPMGQCDFSVARGAGGAATVTIRHPSGHARTIYFTHGKVTNVDSGQAGVRGTFSVSRESDLNMIRVGEERYEIPDAVVTGG